MNDITKTYKDGTTETLKDTGFLGIMVQPGEYADSDNLATIYLVNNEFIVSLINGPAAITEDQFVQRMEKLFDLTHHAEDANDPYMLFLGEAKELGSSIDDAVANVQKQYNINSSNIVRITSDDVF